VKALRVWVGELAKPHRLSSKDLVEPKLAFLAVTRDKGC